MKNQGGEGTVLRNSTQPSISANSKAIDDTHCVPDSETAQFIPEKWRNI